MKILDTQASLSPAQHNHTILELNNLTMYLALSELMNVFQTLTHFGNLENLINLGSQSRSLRTSTN